MRTLPDHIRVDEIAGKRLRRDEAGYLIDPEDWDEKVAAHFAAEEGIALGPQHWDMIAYMRAWLEEHGVMPDARFVFRHLAGMENIDVDAARRRFFELFPYGYVKQACKIAGMRQPRAWSTG